MHHRRYTAMSSLLALAAMGGFGARPEEAPRPDLRLDRLSPPPAPHTLAPITPGWGGGSTYKPLAAYGPGVRQKKRRKYARMRTARRR